MIPARYSCLTLLAVLTLSASAVAQEQINYEDHVKPIFRAKCFSCHNTNKKTADLDLSSYTALMQGGGSGAVIELGAAADSYLFMVMNHDTEPYMPPNSDKLPDEMLQVVRKWIEAGAPETSSSKVMLPKKPSVNLSVDVSAGSRPEGPAPLPDVLNLEPVVRTSATTAISAIATSPWAKLVAVAGQKQVILYSSETLQPLGVLPFPEGQPRVLKFSRNGALLLAGGGHGAAKGLAVVWDIKTGKRMIEVGDELDEVLAADISADQGLVALGGPGRIVRVYSTATGELAYEITKHTDWIYSLEFSPDSILLATTDRSGGLLVWESYTGREYLNLVGHKGAVNSVSWRIDSNVLASASEDTSIKLWEMEEGRNIKSWNAHGGGTSSIEFCRDGRVVSCGRDKVAKLWNQNGEQQRAFEAFGDLALQVTHCDETDRVIAGDWTGEIRVWSAADGARIGNLTTNPPLLEERLQAAESQVPGVQKLLADANAAFEAATAERNAHLQKIEAAKQALAAGQKTVADQQAQLKNEEQQLAAAQQQMQTVQTRLDALNKAMPALTAAAEKAAAAAKAVEADEELKKVVEQINGQLAARTTEKQQQEAALQEAQKQVAAYGQKVAALKEQIPKSEAQVVAFQKALEDTMAGLKPYDEKLAAAEGHRNAQQNAVNQAVAEVDRWKQYIALRDEMAVVKELQQKKDEVQLASLEADAVLKEQQQQIDAMKQKVDTSRTMMAAKQDEAQKMTAAITALQQQETQRAQMIEKHKSAIPALQQAVEQMKAVQAALPEDKEVQQSIAMLTQVSTDKATALDQMTKDSAAAQQMLTETQQSLKTVQESVASLQQTMQQDEAALTEMMAGVTPMQQTAAQAQQMLKQAEEELSKAEAVVEARKEQLRPQLQVTQASAG
jgi:hypothetical protein